MITFQAHLTARSMRRHLLPSPLSPTNPSTTRLGPTKAGHCRGSAQLRLRMALTSHEAHATPRPSSPVPRKLHLALSHSILVSAHQDPSYPARDSSATRCTLHARRTIPQTPRRARRIRGVSMRYMSVILSLARLPRTVLPQCWRIQQCVRQYGKLLLKMAYLLFAVLASRFTSDNFSPTT